MEKKKRTVTMSAPLNLRRKPLNPTKELPLPPLQEKSTSEPLKGNELMERCIQGRPPVISRRMDVNGRPSNGNQQEFEHSFSVLDKSGVKYDFRDGLRVMIPASMNGDFMITAMDADTGFVHFRVTLHPGESATSRKKWFVRWRLIVEGEGVHLDTTLDLKGKEVAIHYPKGGLGDVLAWFSYAPAFQRKHQCNLTCCMPLTQRELLEKAYPEFKWATDSAWNMTPFYAVYHMGIFLPDNENDKQPYDFRVTGLHHNAADILGLPHVEEPPRVVTSGTHPEGKYVCIASRASARCKEWLNPAGWPYVVSWLKDRGYKVYDIDRDFVREDEVIPWGTDNLTGDIPLTNRAAVIKGAAAFIGTSSGLSWLAWCCGVPVVLISGWTMPFTEFYTPYRVINYGVCHGCWNDMREEYDHGDTHFCPRHKGTPREGECSRGISPYQVVQMLEKALEGKC